MTEIQPENRVICVLVAACLDSYVENIYLKYSNALSRLNAKSPVRCLLQLRMDLEKARLVTNFNATIQENQENPTLKNPNLKTPNSICGAHKQSKAGTKSQESKPYPRRMHQVRGGLHVAATVPLEVLGDEGLTPQKSCRLRS